MELRTAECSSCFHDSTCSQPLKDGCRGGISTGVNFRQSDGISEMIQSGVMVSMQNQTTERTSMHPHREGFRYILPAVRAPNAAPFGLGVLQYPATSTRSLVAEHLYEGIPRSVRDVFGEMMIMEHSRNIQIFNGNSSELIGDDSREFMLEVSPLIGDLDVCFGKPIHSLTTILAPLDLSGYLPLKLFESPLALDQVSWVWNMFPRAEGCKTLDADINTDRFVDVGVRSGWKLDLAGKDGKPLTSPVPLDGHGLDPALRNPVQNNRDVANLGDVQSPVRNELEPELGIGYALESLFEAGKANLNLLASILLLNPSKEVGIRLAQSIGTVLQGLRVHTIELRISILNLFNHHTELGLAVQRGIVSLVGIFATLEQEVIKLTAQIKLREQTLLLNLGRIQPIFIHSQFHDCINGLSKYKLTAIHPTVKTVGFLVRCS